MSEIPALFAQRVKVLCYRKATIYHPMVEALAMALADMPFTLGSIILSAIVVYFIVKLQQSAGQSLYPFSCLAMYATFFF